MKKYLFLLLITILSIQAKANIEYKLRYNPTLDMFEVYFVSTLSYGSPVFIGGSQATLVFDASYSIGPASIVTTPVNGGPWTPQDRVTGNTGTLNGRRVVAWFTIGAPMVGGVTAGAEYILFRFSFGAGLNCSGVLRPFVNGVDPIDPDGAGGDFASLLAIGIPVPVDYLSTNSNTAFQTCANLTLVASRFLSFSAVKTGDNGLLNWKVANEDANTSSYEVERSLNRLDFKTIATVNAKHNGQADNAYELTDRNLSSLRSNGVIYYRIKQLDTDGQITYSEIRTLRLKENAVAVLLYPNPARSFVNLETDLSSAGPVTVSITDATGKEVKRMELAGLKGLNQQRINLLNFAAGRYVLTVTSGTEVQSVPFVKTL